MPPSLSERAKGARSRLRVKLLKLDLASLEVSAYNRRYLSDKLLDIVHALNLYLHVLDLALTDRPVPLDDFVLVDYGGGSGLISLLAREIGVGTVIYNDIYDVSCSDMEDVSAALGLAPDHIVCGDIDAVISHVRDTRIVVNAVASYDVLEHIYDVEDHFEKLGSLSDEWFRAVYASGANIKNPRIVRGLEKTHHEVENEDRTDEVGWKERDTLRSYLSVRGEMIEGFNPDLSAETIDLLAGMTRGLRRDDIEQCVAEYQRTGGITYRPDHPTNTCDPNTGNWCEHLMPTEWLEDIVQKLGFTGEILAGPYPISGTTAKRAVKRTLNAGIRIFGRRALAIAPYYVLDVQVPPPAERRSPFR